MSKSIREKIETARHTLTDMGFYVGNLWHVSDVQSKFKCTHGEAAKVLDKALRENEATYDQIRMSIDYAGENLGLERVDDEDI